MEQYEEWPEEDQNFSENYPIRNIMVSEIPNQNQLHYRIRKFIPSNNISLEPQIYPSKGQIIQEKNKYINYNNNNPKPYYNINNQINNNNYHNQRIYYSSQNRDINKSSHNNYDNYNKYKSSDGVLRGYTNNFSFYESNSSKIKPKIITNSSSQNNHSNNFNTNNLQYNYQRTNITQDTKRRYQSDINNNMRNRQIINTNENDNPPYIIRVIEDEPVEYISPNAEYEDSYNNMNFINNNNENDYNDNDNDNEIENRYEAQNFRPPATQRRMIKRLIHKQPNSQREDYYIIEPQNNLRKYNNNQNINRNDLEQNNNPNLGYRKIYSYDVNRGNDLNSYQSLGSNNTSNIQYSNYSRPIKQIRYIEPHFSKNNIIIESYSDKYPYKTFTEQNNDYIIEKVENSFPRNRSPFLGPYSNINNKRDNEYIFHNQFRPKQREYTSRTEQNQRGYEYEYEEDDDVYEVPEQYNKDRDYNEERRQNNFSDRPFTRVKNYSQAVRNGKKYGVYTQTLEMNRNYYSNNDGEEYEYEMPNNRKNRNRENYSQPKKMRPINDVQKLIRNKREYSAFGRSLRNIRNNEEEIELENEARNNRIRSKANGENNIRFISNNNGHPSREYKTFTEQQDNRTQEQGYILEDIDDSNFEDYDTYQNQSNKNIEISPNKLNERNRIQKQYIQGKDYYERAQEENMQNYGEQEVEEDDDNDGEGQMYDSNRLFTDKKDNFGILQNNVENENNNNPDINEEIEQAQIQMNEGEMEEQRSTENDRIYRREEIHEDIDEERLPNGKNLKNIETEICEKYYDNQGNYLGERKIITKNKIPKEENLPQAEEYYEEQEEIEENENEYMPYQSSNKKFKKRGENMVRRKGPKDDNDNDMNKNQNLKMNKELKSKYKSYYGDSNNNVYYEIKKTEEDSKNDKETGNKTYKQPITLVKNVTFGIHSENLCVPADDNENDNNNRGSEKQRNSKSNSNNDEKEADEQQIEENEVIEVDEEQNQVTLNQNDRNNNLTIEQNINKNINDDNDINGESENINENKNIESQNSEKNYNYKYIEENNLYNDDENNYQNYKENNNYYDENIDNNEENRNINDKNGEYNMEYENENEEERIYEENEVEEIENQNIQKDEGEEEDNKEQDNNYNYQKEQENDYEENQNYDEEEEIEQREDYNIIEEDNTNKDEVNDNKEGN